MLERGCRGDDDDEGRRGAGGCGEDGSLPPTPPLAYHPVNKGGGDAATPDVSSVDPRIPVKRGGDADHGRIGVAGGEGDEGAVSSNSPWLVVKARVWGSPCEGEGGGEGLFRSPREHPSC